MKFFIVLLAAISLSSALKVKEAEVCDGCTATASPLELLYRKRQAPFENIADEFSLVCNGDQFTVTLRAKDSLERSEQGYVQLAGQTNILQANGGREIILTGSVEDLTLTSSGCCGARRSGLVEVRQYVKVPGAKALHWYGFYNVKIQCGAEPTNPENLLEQGPPLPYELLVDGCIYFGHELNVLQRYTRGIFNATIEVNKAGLSDASDIFLSRCTLQSATRSRTFIERGVILNYPDIAIDAEQLPADRLPKDTAKYIVAIDLTKMPRDDYQLVCKVQLCNKYTALTYNQEINVPKCPMTSRLDTQGGVQSVAKKSPLSPTSQGATLAQKGVVTMMRTNHEECTDGNARK